MIRPVMRSQIHGTFQKQGVYSHPESSSYHFLVYPVGESVSVWSDHKIALKIITFDSFFGCSASNTWTSDTLLCWLCPFFRLLNHITFQSSIIDYFRSIWIGRAQLPVIISASFMALSYQKPGDLGSQHLHSRPVVPWRHGSNSH